MAINILAFGNIAEITGKQFAVEAPDTESLRAGLNLRFPALAQLTFLVAVNKSVIKENTVLQQADEVALLPPYSGG